MLNIYKYSESVKQRLTQYGFVHLKCSSTDFLQDIKSSLQQLQFKYSIPNIDYHVTLLSDSYTYKKEVEKILLPLFDNICNEIMPGYTVLLTNMIIKNPYSGEVPLHQNWSFVDETTHRSYTIWIPLQDIMPNNGALEFIAGSHNLFCNEPRGHNTPYFFMNDREQLQSFKIPIFIQSGDALLFDDAIIHYSAANKTESPRLAIQAILTPKDVPLLHYHYKRSIFGSKIYRIKVKKQFYDSMPIQIDKYTPYNYYKLRRIKPIEWQTIENLYKKYLLIK